jgi:hypothetical protein
VSQAEAEITRVRDTLNSALQDTHVSTRRAKSPVRPALGGLP